MYLDVELAGVKTFLNVMPTSDSAGRLFVLECFRRWQKALHTVQAYTPNIGGMKGPFGGYLGHQSGIGASPEADLSDRLQYALETTQ